MAGEKTRDAWITAAATLGIGFKKGLPEKMSDSLDLRGTIDGFPVTSDIHRSDKSSWTTFTIHVGDLPPGLKIRRRTVTLLPIFAKRGVLTGNPEWDSTMTTGATVASQAQIWLTDERQRAILSANEEKPRPKIGKDKITITHAGVVTKTGQIVKALLRLAALASALDLTAPIPEVVSPTAESRTAARVWNVLAWILVAAAVLTVILGFEALGATVAVSIALGLVVVAMLGFNLSRR